MCREVYVTGARSDSREIGEFVVSLESTGQFKQQHRWFCGASPRDPADLEAVERAQMVIAVMTDPEHDYISTWSEVRKALKLAIPVVIIGPDTTESAQHLLWHDQRIEHVEDTGAFVRSASVDAIQAYFSLPII